MCSKNEVYSHKISFYVLWDTTKVFYIIALLIKTLDLRKFLDLISYKTCFK